MFSILHISDLHRSPFEPVDNDALVAALINDCDRYVGETPDVRPPDVIVVSGDIIQGVSLESDNWELSIKNQYQVALEFLEHLTRRFLGGDRSRIVLVPGNHDVCWNTSLCSMEIVEENEYPKSIQAAIASPNSIYRWSWKDLSLYRIRDMKMYESRLSAYWEFIETFYYGSRLSLPLDKRRGYQLYEFDSRNIGLVAFESVYRNDCFSSSGALDAGVLARCSLFLRDYGHTHKLKIGVWHHSVQGPPMNNDYMDINSVHVMTGYGFQLGLHGHQHTASASSYNIQLADSLSMAIVSSGSLCAGSNELPRGQNRQYNIITLDDHYRSARVHVREMTDGGHFTSKRNGAFVTGYVDVPLNVAVDTAGRNVQTDVVNERNIVLKSEEYIHNGSPDLALQLLRKIPLAAGTYCRTLALEAAKRTSAWDQIKEILVDATDTDEKMLLLSAHEQLGEYDLALNILSSMADLNASIRNELEERLNIRKAMRCK